MSEAPIISARDVRRRLPRLPRVRLGGYVISATHARRGLLHPSPGKTVGVYAMPRSISTSLASGLRLCSSSSQPGKAAAVTRALELDLHSFREKLFK
jgi:hypothetical protein